MSQKKFTLAIFIGRRSRLCNQKLAVSGEPETGWASQPVRMTLIEVSGSYSVTNHDLPKLSGSVRVITGLMLLDSSIIGVIKSLLQYSGTFESSYHASFEKALISDIYKEPVSSEFL